MSSNVYPLPLYSGCRRCFRTSLKMSITLRYYSPSTQALSSALNWTPQILIVQVAAVARPLRPHQRSRSRQLWTSTTPIPTGDQSSQLEATMDTLMLAQPQAASSSRTPSAGPLMYPLPARTMAPCKSGSLGRRTPSPKWSRGYPLLEDVAASLEGSIRSRACSRRGRYPSCWSRSYSAESNPKS